MTTYRTPDGKYTTSSRRYIKEWRSITRPIEKGLGLKTIGFDPGLLMSNHDGQGAIDMPLWFAKRLAEKLGLRQAASVNQPKRSV